MPTPIIDADRCKGCELCVFACPERVLEMSPNINAKGYFLPDVVRLASSIERKQPARIDQTFQDTITIERSQSTCPADGATGGANEAMIELYSKLQFVCIIGRVWFPFQIAFPITLNIVL